MKVRPTPNGLICLLFSLLFLLFLILGLAQSQSQAQAQAQAQAVSSLPLAVLPGELPQAGSAQELIEILQKEPVAANRRTILKKNPLLVNNAFLNLLLGLAYQAAQEGDLGRARTLNQVALEVALHLGNKQGQGISALYAGMFFGREGNWSEARARFVQALALFDNIRYKEGLASAHFNLANALQRLGDAEGARAGYEKALLQYRELGDKNGSADCTIHLAGMLVAAGHLAEAARSYQEARLIKEELGDTAGVAALEVNLGNIAATLGQLEAALEHFRQALSRHQAVADLPREAADHALLAHNLDCLGRLEEAVPEYLAAIDAYDRALLPANGAPLKLDLARCLYRLDREGESAQVRSDVEKQALAGNLHALWADIHRQEAWICEQNADSQGAEAAWQAAAESARVAGQNIAQGRDLMRLGNSCFRAGRITPAGNAYDQARQCFRAAGDQTGEARAMAAYALWAAASGRLSQGREIIEQARKIQYQQGDREGLAENALVAASLALRIGDVAAAREHLTSAENYARGFHRPDLTWRARYLAGRAALWQDNREGALPFFLAARDAIITSCPRRDDRDQDLPFAETAFEVFEDTIDLLLSLDRESDALAVAESERSYDLLQSLDGISVPFTRAPGAALAMREQELRARLKVVGEGLDQELRRPAGRLRKPYVQELGQEYDRLAAEHADLIKRLQVESPHYADLAGSARFNYSDLLRRIEPDTLFLEYRVGRKAAVLWALDSSGVEAHRIPVPGDELALQVTGYREMFRPGITPLENLDAIGKVLGDRLLGLVRRKMENKRLVVALHGPLWYLPLAALPDSSGHRLLETNPLVMTGSATTYLLATDLPLPPRDCLAVFALGGLAVSIGAQFLPGLPSTRAQATTLASLFPTGRVLAGADFLPAALPAAAAPAGVLHFGTYGIERRIHPLYSSLVTGGRPLRIYDVFGLDLAAAPVTISAARFAPGPGGDGRELALWQQAFLTAGMPSLLLGLWPVDEEAAGIFFEEFYRNFMGRRSRLHQIPDQPWDLAYSLQQAALVVSRDKRFSHPYYWTPFILLGGWK